MTKLLILRLLVAYNITTAAFTGDGTAYTLGAIGSGNCNFMHSGFAQASTNYVAINNEQWAGLTNCGRCINVKCIDSRCTNTHTAMVQVLDRCPECKYGDLDMSPTVFKEITGSDPSRYKIEWDFVDCPVQGNIKYCANIGSNGYWMAIQPTNFASGIKSMKINGNPADVMQGAYYYLMNTQWVNISNIRIDTTDINGYTITDTVDLLAGSCKDGSAQFPSTGTQPSEYSIFEEIDC